MSKSPPSQTFELSSKQKAANLKKVIFVKEEKLRYILQLFYCIKYNSKNLPEEIRTLNAVIDILQ